MLTLRYLCVQDGMKGWAPEQVRTVRNQGLKGGYKEEEGKKDEGSRADGI